MSKVEAAMMPRTCAQVARKYAKGGSLQAGARTRSILRTAATRGRDARTVVEKATAGLAGAKSSACASRRNLSACSQATSTVSEVQRVLGIDLRGKKAFVAGVADDKGFGWAISKALAEAGCEIILGTWVPALKIFETSYRRGKFAESATLSDGSQMQFKHVYPMDAVFDKMGDVPEEVRTNKRYAAADGDFSVEGVAKRVAEDVGNIDIIVHSLANGPEVQKPLLMEIEGVRAAVQRREPRELLPHAVTQLRVLRDHDSAVREQVDVGAMFCDHPRAGQWLVDRCKGSS